MPGTEISFHNKTDLKPIQHEIFPLKCKVSSKILIKQHLDAHYRNIQSVKACIDNTTPYSFSHNPTTKGYRKSSKIAHRRPFSVRAETTSLCDLTAINTFSDDPEVDRIVRKFVLDSSEKQIELFGPSEHHSEVVKDKRKRDKSVCSNGEPMVLRRLDVDCLSTKTVHRRQLSSADVLDIHRNKFTSPKPFSPRTVKSSIPSKLISLRCYNPPKRTSRRRSGSKVSSDGKSVIHCKKSLEACAVNSDLETEDNNKHKESITDREEITSSQLNNRTSNFSSKRTPPSLHHRRGSQRHRRNQSVPADLLGGLHNFGKVKQWLNTLPGNGTSHKPEIVTSSQHDEEKLEKSFLEKKLHKENTDKQMLNKPTMEEKSVENIKNEVNYLKFISSVTDDVLTRGVLTDKNVNTILQEHATTNEYDLSKDQISKAIKHIRTQLNITNEITTTTPPLITNDMSYLVNYNSSKLSLNNNETMMYHHHHHYHVENEKTHHVHQQQQQLLQQPQPQNESIVSYKTILDIKPSRKYTSPLMSAFGEEKHPLNNQLLMSTTPLSPTTPTPTTITIRPNHCTNLPKDVQEIFQNLMNNNNNTDEFDKLNDNTNNNHLFQQDYELQKDQCSIDEHQNVYVEKLVDKQNLPLNRLNITDEFIDTGCEQHCDNETNADIEFYENNLNHQLNALQISNITNNNNNSTVTANPNSINHSKQSNTLNRHYTKPNDAFINHSSIQYNSLDINNHLITTEHANNANDNDDGEMPNAAYQSRVKFASEAEFFSPSYLSEQATSVSSFTDLSHLSNFTNVTISPTNTITISTNSTINTGNATYNLQHTSFETTTTLPGKSSLQISNLNTHINNSDNAKVNREISKTLTDDWETTKEDKTEEPETSSYKDDFLSEDED
ncbi:unnamed protein product [Schistosoma turkestanicum]|nr:unnamed protein product [Schistosoma turkestanicum]